MTDEPETNTGKNQQKQRHLKEWVKPELAELRVSATQGGPNPSKHENKPHHPSP